MDISKSVLLQAVIRQGEVLERWRDHPRVDTVCAVNVGLARYFLYTATEEYSQRSISTTYLRMELVDNDVNVPRYSLYFLVGSSY